MKKLVTLAAAGLMAVGLSMEPAIAAESGTTVKVALTDITASMGMGPMGQYMMSQGMMGGYGVGQGMMGGGQGMMGSYGMMRPGYGGGPGVMDPAMGMMAIRIDHDTLKTGPVSFEVTNWSRVMVHEMLIVAVDDPTVPLPYDFKATRVDEAQLKVLADTAELQPNMSKTLEVTLPPGTYLLICNVAGHYAAGMAAPLRVLP